MNILSSLVPFLSRHRRLVLAMIILVTPPGIALAYQIATTTPTPQAPSAGRTPPASDVITVSPPSTTATPKQSSSPAPMAAKPNKQPQAEKSPVHGTDQGKKSEPNKTQQTTAPAACPEGQTGTPPQCTVPPPIPLGISGNWRLIFRDEFDSLNTAIWSTQRGPSSYSYGDPYNPSIEDAFYLPTNPKAVSGNLVLTLNQGATNGYPYSSGMVQNGRSFSYKYGYVEARVKVPGATGVWPAFWTLAAPVDQYWPPEIDIFEFGLQSQTRPSFNYHYGSSPQNQQMGLVAYGNPGTNYSQNFHTYGMLWTNTKIQVFIDGQPGPAYTNTSTITSLPQYIIFNLALKKGYTVPSGTAMYVDYVRVWQ